MIQLVTGPLGMGKTLFVCMLIFEDLCKGFTVVTNIDIVWDEIELLARRDKGVILNPAQLIRVDPEEARDWQRHIPFGVMGAPVKAYWDEIHLFFNARDWAQTGKDHGDLLSFLSQSRKARVDVTFIAQERENMEKQFRVLAEWELAIISSHHVPLGVFRMLPKCFIVRYRDAQKGYQLRKEWRRYDKRFFRCYRSHSFLDSGMKKLADAAKEVGPYKLLRVSYFRRCWLDICEPFRLLSETSWFRAVRARLKPQPICEDG
jgi:hypothetical protein